MDTEAHQEAPDLGAPSSDAGPTEDAGASAKSAGIDKGKAPEVPEIRTIPDPASAGQAAPAAPEQASPQTPSSEKTPAPAKTSAPAKTTAPAKSIAPAKTTAPAQTGALKIQPAKSGTPKASSALALHLGRAAARPGYRTSFFDTPELEGLVPLVTKSDHSLGSLKEQCTKWNDASNMDTADSRSKKLAEAKTSGDPSDFLAAKPIPIASELLSIQQRLHKLASATNVSSPYLLTYPQSPKMSAVRDVDIRDFLISFALSCFLN
jgi:hypothetical protein